MFTGFRLTPPPAPDQPGHQLTGHQFRNWYRNPFRNPFRNTAAGGALAVLPEFTAPGNCAGNSGGRGGESNYRDSAQYTHRPTRDVRRGAVGSPEDLPYRHALGSWPVGTSGRLRGRSSAVRVRATAVP